MGGSGKMALLIEAAVTAICGWLRRVARAVVTGDLGGVVPGEHVLTWNNIVYESLPNATSKLTRSCYF